MLMPTRGKINDMPRNSLGKPRNLASKKDEPHRIAPGGSVSLQGAGLQCRQFKFTSFQTDCKGQK
jgi:hypothetical protein